MCYGNHIALRHHTIFDHVASGTGQGKRFTAMRLNSSLPAGAPPTEFMTAAALRLRARAAFQVGSGVMFFFRLLSRNARHAMQRRCKRARLRR